MSSPGEAFSDRVDYDLHGIVGVRLVDATPRDEAAVTRQLGPIHARLQRAPDIVIRFMDRLPPSSGLRLLGAEEAAFTDDAFLILRSKHKSRVRVQIPFDRIGSERCEILCERGLAAVPLLIPIVNLTALARGALPLHASAFEYEGTGVLTTGWSKGGKTELLLAFVERGARFIGDEWVYISPNGQTMGGIPEPIRVWSWHLSQLSSLRARIGAGERLRLRLLEQGHSRVRGLARALGRSTAAARALSRVESLLAGQLHVNVEPGRLFGAPIGALRGKLHRVLFVASHEDPETRIEPIDPVEVARRMVFSLQFERSAFVSFYRAYRFAFPHARNELIERAEEIERARLTELLADKEALAVIHPYPFAIRPLCDAVCERLRRGTGNARRVPM